MSNTKSSFGSIGRWTVRLLVAAAWMLPNAASTETCSVSRDAGMPPKDVHRSAVAATLSRLIYELGDDAVLDADRTTLLESHGFSAPKHFVTTLDRGLGARHGNDYCLMAFRGTVFLQPKDLLTNLEIELIEFTSIAEEYYDDYEYNDDDAYNQTNSTEAMSCDLHKGYYTAYLTFKDEMEAYLDTCTSECPTCEVVLTGHSQGGGISEIYAMLHKKRFDIIYNNDDDTDDRYDGTITKSMYMPSQQPPYVITFGGVRSLGKGCMQFISKEERCRQFHYLMGTDDLLGRTLDIDYIPTLMANSYFIARGEGYTEYTYIRNGVAAPGHMIMVSSDDALSSYYMGFDGNYTYRVTDLPIDFSGQAHNKKLYSQVLNALGDNYATGSNPLPTNGFSLDAVCDIAFDLCQDGLECVSVGLSQREVCRPIGESGGSSRRIGVRSSYYWLVSILPMLAVAGGL